MKFLGPKPFRGYTLRDVLQYLQVEATKGFADLFAILSKIPLEERFEAAGTDEMADFSASGTSEDIASLTLDPGTWNVFGSAQFDDNGATGTTYAQAWIGLKPTSASGTVFGYSATEVALSNVNPWFHATCFRRVTLPKRQTVYLGSRGFYSAGGPIQRMGSIWAIGRV